MILIEETDLYKCPIKPLQSDLDLIRDFVGQTSALDTLNQEICKHAFFYVTKWDKILTARKKIRR